MTPCCSHRCNQGRDCPLRVEPVDTNPAGEPMSWELLAYAVAIFIGAFLAAAMVLGAAMVLPLP